MLDDITKERRKKLDVIRDAGIDPYPARVERSFAIARAIEQFGKLAEEAVPVSLVGRLRGIRDQGKIIFADIEDESGQIQAVIKEDTLPGDSAESFAFLRSVIDLGDFISVTGPLFMTKKGEKSVDVTRAAVVAKSLLPLPDKWEGLMDTETRLRERYVDLIAHPEVREMFRKKSLFWQATREFLLRERFLEVETGVIESLAGGAEAEPFKTHHNALDTDFYLRISLELQLKKLIVGGFDKVFEIGRVFRNEGIDRDHLQDFTFMECYAAYDDYRSLMVLLEAMLKEIVKKTTNGLTTEWHDQAEQVHEIDWGGKWPEIDYREAFKKENDGLDPIEAGREKLLVRAKALDLKVDAKLGEGRLIDLIYKKTVRPKLIQPCFLVNHPILVSPLSKASSDNPHIAERFQIVACATELGNGYSELNDPQDQRKRFEMQMKLKEKGDVEAMSLDEDFLKALEYGMPPTAGFGMSERVFAVLMDKPVRETVFFPLMRAKK
jgi:lysyl-tRNA synthetase class 2